MKKFAGKNVLQNFSHWVVNHQYIIIGIFVLLIILSLVGNFFVQKESDVISYLDNDTITKEGLANLQSEFDIIGDFSMGLSYLSLNQIRDIVKEIDKIQINEKKYIKNLVWIDTFKNLSNLTNLNINENKILQVQDQLENKFIIHSKLEDGNTVDTYLISVYFTTPNSSDETIKTIDEIEKILIKHYEKYIEDGTITTATKAKECYAFGGSAQNSRSLLKSSVGDMPKFVIAAVIAVFVILFITTTSYLEPLIFLATLGISILLNMGTNIIAGQNPVGTISSITASCATILQLAVAMDYAIFLMHTYYEELRTTPDPKIAMEQALPKTIKSIVASSLTTVGGFFALFFMKFGIGYDLGFVLAKGVILSLITVICLQPIIILLTNKLVTKTSHKWNVTIRLKSVSKIITKKGIAIPIILICIALVIPAAIFQSKVNLSFISINKVNKNPTYAEAALEESSNMFIVMTPYHSYIRTGAQEAKSYNANTNYFIKDDTDATGYKAVGKISEEQFNKGTYYIGEYTILNSSSTYQDHFEFIKEVYTVGYVKAQTFEENTIYYIQDETTCKMLKKEDITKDNFIPDTLYIRDENVNVITDIFSLCTILDSDSLNTIDNSGIVGKNSAYQQLHQSFISNIINKDAKPLQSNYINNGVGSEHYMLYTMNIDGGKEDIASYNTFLKIREIANNIFSHDKYESQEVKMTGNVVASYELSQVTPKDYKLVNILSVVIIFIILLMTFKSPILAALLVLVIETGIWINLSLSYFMGTTLHFMAYLIVSAIALGATVDYAILVTSKYLEEKQNGATSQAAIRNAIYRAAPGVLTSGSIFFVACIAVRIISTNIIVQQITELLARNAVFSVILVFTYLPAVLSMVERFKKFISIKRGKGDPDEGKTDVSIYSVSSKELENYKKQHDSNATKIVEDSPQHID